jgi:peptidyl-prolyl cis-trans isomerase B (cyclophilin B)
MSGLRRHGIGLTLALVVGAAWTPATLTGEEPAAEELRGVLAVEVTPVSRLIVPQRPVRVRFTLHNPSDTAVVVPLAQAVATEDGLGLPRELVLGTAEQPALLLSYESETATPVRPTAEAGGAEPGVLRLAPHGSLGMELDLQELTRALRYPGQYRLTWRPLGGALGEATATFRIEARREAVIVTDYGKITFELAYDTAPVNVENFLDLVRSGFYDGKQFHRIVPNMAAQGGCPQGDGRGVRPDGRLVPGEFTEAPFTPGTLAMARRPDQPDSASCQFFIALGRVPELDGKYTIIGQARDEHSMRTLQQLAAVSTDRSYRPQTPVFIRSVNLTETAQTTRLELGEN